MDEHALFGDWDNDVCVGEVTDELPGSFVVDVRCRDPGGILIVSDEFGFELFVVG
ncbi:hypothetical protein [Halogeometricum rufum]|uniref:hypothetical protein n=1 Tax=Halogeometricum rufum TaxID=553469 RepID=UPI0015A6F7ED